MSDQNSFLGGHIVCTGTGLKNLEGRIVKSIAIGKYDGGAESRKQKKDFHGDSNLILGGYC